MPELPEVETILRALAPRLVGRRILDVRILAKRVVAGDPAKLRQHLRNRRIIAVKRRAKFLLVELEDGVMSIHLGMTGSLRWNGVPGPYTRAVFSLSGARLLFDDLRQFGRIEVGPEPPARLAQLGPEALEVSVQELAARLRGRRAPIKALLLDQRVVAGLGNIYADEALFRAGIHPGSSGGSLSGARVRRLHNAIRTVLSEAIAAGGSSVANYVNADGAPGKFQLSHNVYRRTGLPCPRCGARIRRIVVAQRGTHYCPRCQRG